MRTIEEDTQLFCVSVFTRTDYAKRINLFVCAAVLKRKKSLVRKINKNLGVKEVFLLDKKKKKKIVVVVGSGKIK